MCWPRGDDVGGWLDVGGGAARHSTHTVLHGREFRAWGRSAGPPVRRELGWHFRKHARARAPSRRSRPLALRNTPRQHRLRQIRLPRHGTLYSPSCSHDDLLGPRRTAVGTSNRPFCLHPLTLVAARTLSPAPNAATTKKADLATTAPSATAREAKAPTCLADPPNTAYPTAPKTTED